MSRIAVLLVPALFVIAGPAFAEDFTVRQKGSVFDPAELTVHAGDKVIFLNDDNRTHNAYSTAPGNTFDTKAQRPGAQTEINLSTPGTIEVLCAIHVKMKMTIHVE
jgi:plastocyanin